MRCRIAAARKPTKATVSVESDVRRGDAEGEQGKHREKEPAGSASRMVRETPLLRYRSYQDEVERPSAGNRAPRQSRREIQRPEEHQGDQLGRERWIAGAVRAAAARAGATQPGNGLERNPAPPMTPMAIAKLEDVLWLMRTAARATNGSASRNARSLLAKMASRQHQRRETGGQQQPARWRRSKPSVFNRRAVTRRESTVVAATNITFTCQAEIPVARSTSSGESRAKGRAAD